MRRLAILLCAVGCVAATRASARGAENEVQTAALVDQLQNGSDATKAGAALLELSKALRTAPTQTVGATQARLCQALWASDSALTIRRLALVLSAAPCEDALVVLANRLGANPPPIVGMALCDGMHSIADQRPPVSPATVMLALSRLDAIARNQRLPAPLIQSAVMATAAFGSAGFDQLMKLKEVKDSGKIQNILYTALSETDDPRALTFLRQAVAETSGHDSRQAQAVYGLGQMFSRAAAAGQPIDPVERNACALLLEAYLNDAVPDRVFAAAIKSLVRMVDVQRDIGLQQIMRSALESSSDVRRTAALEALYQQEGPLESNLYSAVQQLAESEHNADAQSVAAAILEKEQAFQTYLPSK